EIFGIIPSITSKIDPFLSRLYNIAVPMRLAHVPKAAARIVLRGDGGDRAVFPFSAFPPSNFRYGIDAAAPEPRREALRNDPLNLRMEAVERCDGLCIEVIVVVVANQDKVDRREIC